MSGLRSSVVLGGLALLATVSLVFAVTPQVRTDDALFYAPTSVLAAAGIPYTNTVFADGHTYIRGVVRYVPKDSRPQTGISSAVVFYCREVSPTNDAVILWGDAARTNEMGRFSLQ